MPLPKPKSSEKQSDFIERCMNDGFVKDEFNDEDQRLAVCYSLWSKEKNAMTYKCECLDCGHVFETEEHCAETKCPKCGGDCRRAERPGPGRSGTAPVETRAFPVEMRVAEDGQKITGHAAVFNKLSEDLGGFREQILPGAFTKALKRSDVRALWNHDANIVLGRTKAGTLRLEEDDKGLRVEIDPPSWASGYMETIKRGDVNEMSFAFTVAEDEIDGEKNIRSIREFDRIYDVSPVTYPAYPQTSVKVRMDEADKAEIVDKIGSYFSKPDEPDIQGSGPDGAGSVDSVELKRQRLELAGK